ncbi:MAG: PsiF family protein, partial [Rhodovarius sp.]|nr:PsiF family protein [Rhodovarius sp.]
AIALLVGALSPALAQNPPPPRQPTEAQARQQERMRACHAEAAQRNLAGEARRAFMSACLAGR